MHSLTPKPQVYNTKLKPMNLVLFENALEHLARIERVLEMPRGNLLLVECVSVEWRG